MQGNRPPPRWLCPALALVAGFVDCASFVHLGGVFCAHVTGNIVVLVSDLAPAEPVRWLSVASIPVFVLAVALVQRLIRARANDADGGSRASRTLQTVLAFEGAFISFAALLGLMADASHNSALAAVIVLSLVVAMAAQSVLHRLHPELGPCSTVMTGNLAHWVMLRFDPAGVARANRFGPVVAMFILGCVLSLATIRLLGLGMLLLPVCVLYACAAMSDQMAHQPAPLERR